MKIKPTKPDPFADLYKKLNDIYILSADRDDSDLIGKAVAQAIEKELNCIISLLESNLDPSKTIEFIEWNP